MSRVVVMEDGAMDDRKKRQRGRNLALLGVLVGVVVLLFFVTMARLGGMQ